MGRGRHEVEHDARDMVCLECVLPECNERARECLRFGASAAPGHDALEAKREQWRRRFHERYANDPGYREAHRASVKAARERMLARRRA